MVQTDNNPLPDNSHTSDNSLPPPATDPGTVVDLTAKTTAGAPVKQPTNTSTSQSELTKNTPEIAEDADLIEKEWVEKAKHIIEKAKNDPHLLNKEINMIKADYIKKRYNKDIKIDET